MSTSIAIPAGPSSAYDHDNRRRSSSSKATGSSSSSYCSSPQTPQTPKSSPASAQKQRVMHHRRPSLLSSAISKEDAHTIDIGDSDGPLRLISYLASSQGFTWNPEIFLPSYIDCDYTPLENRREPVHDIVVSDEEVKNMFPQ